MGAKSLVPLTSISQITNPLWGITPQMIGENDTEYSSFMQNKRRGDMFVISNPETFAHSGCKDFFSDEIENTLIYDDPSVLWEDDESYYECEECCENLSDEEYLCAWEERLAKIQPAQEIAPAQCEDISLFIPRRTEKMFCRRFKWKGEWRKEHSRGRKRPPTISEKRKVNVF